MISIAAGADFTRRVREASGVAFDRCYQCLTCTLSCPVGFAMDYLPHQIVRMVQGGSGPEVLSSRTIWVCASCETCAVHCPNEIDIPRLMDTLRQMAFRQAAPAGERSVPAFHRAFIGSIRRWGREYELGMVLGLKMKTRDFFSDLGMGLRMVLKRKMNILPHRIKGSAEVAAIFERCQRAGQQ
jgi:heterodisulfide reductase subunit C